MGFKNNQKDNQEIPDERLSRRRNGQRGGENLNIIPKAKPSFADALLSGPLDFYGFYFKVNDEDKDLILRDAMIKKLRFKLFYYLPSLVFI